FSLRHDGWRIDNFKANPVVLWMHNAFAPPIGRADAFKEEPKLKAAVTFDPEDELARLVDSKYRRGFLSAVSVGLDFVDSDGAALDWWRLKPEQIRDEAFYDLAELSAVTVPADPSAVVEQKRLALARLGHELVELFDEQERPDSAVGTEQINAAVRAELSRLGIPDAARPEADGVDKRAASAVFAAFTLLGGPSGG
ncbi:MAG: hypothetical protein ACRDTT_08460, partial [Pseudonocardiaceae bacterium]